MIKYVWDSGYTLHGDSTHDDSTHGDSKQEASVNPPPLFAMLYSLIINKFHHTDGVAVVVIA